MSKRSILCGCMLLALMGRADQLLLEDNFKKPQWRAINTATILTNKNQVLLLNDNRRYRADIIQHKALRGAQFTLHVEARGTGKIKTGLIFYGAETTVVWSNEYELDSQFKLFEFAAETPDEIQRLVPVITGAGEYCKVRLIQREDPDYTLCAKPAYQMVVSDPEKVDFTLYHKDQAVADALVVVSNLTAFHRESGTTAQAWIDIQETRNFDAVARDIKIASPVNILYLGDSLTHFDIGHNHVDKTAYFINKYNPGKVNAFNYACGGDTIRSVMVRLDGEGKGKYKDRFHDLWTRNYDWAFILLGHNDTKASSANDFKDPVVSLEEQANRYEELLKRLRKQGIKRIVLVSATSSNYELCLARSLKNTRTHNRFGMPEHMENFNEVLKKLAVQHRVEYLDVYTTMKAMSNKATLLNPHDGVHLSAEGHDFIAIETLKFIRETQ